MNLAVAAFAAGLSLAGLAATPAVVDSLAVRTDSGVVVGRQVDQMRSLKDIPYAAAAVGKLRWAQPQGPASVRRAVAGLLEIPPRPE